MASHVSFVLGGLLLVFLTCHSAPIEKVNPNAPPSPPAAINQELLQPTENDKTPADAIGAAKRKREIVSTDELFDHYPTLDEDDDDDNEHILYTNVKESPETLHGNVDRLIDTDDANLFSDLQMNPNELATILHRRRRRDVKLMDRSIQRGKRSLAAYDLSSSDSFSDPWANLAEEQPYVRPLRSFAPIYWYPTRFERNVGSYGRTAWPVEYVNPFITDADVNDDGDDDDDDDASPNGIYDAEGDDNDYELNRYPLLLKSSYASPYDNLQLQQMYNSDDFPLDDNDDDSLAVIEDLDGNEDDDDDDEDDDEYPIIYRQERPSYIPYGPIDNSIEV